MTDEKPFEIVLPAEIEKQIPFLFRGPVKDFIKFLNKLDLNKDGKGDVKQLAPYVIKALPFIIELSKHIDWDAVIQFVIDKFTKDKTLASAEIDKIKAVAGEAAQEVKLA